MFLLYYNRLSNINMPQKFRLYVRKRQSRLMQKALVVAIPLSVVRVLSTTTGNDQLIKSSPVSACALELPTLPLMDLTISLPLSYYLAQPLASLSELAPRGSVVGFTTTRMLWNTWRMPRYYESWTHSVNPLSRETAGGTQSVKKQRTNLSQRGRRRPTSVKCDYSINFYLNTYDTCVTTC